MMRSARALAALLCLCGLLAGAGAVEARGGARDRYQRGAKLFQKGLFAEALTEFEAAYKMQQLPRLLFKMAQAHLALGHGGEALSLYARFLQMEPKPPADIKAQVEQDTERAKAMVQAAEELAARERAAKEPPPPPDPAPEPSSPGPGPATDPSPPRPGPEETPRPAPAPAPATPAPAPVRPAPPPEIARPAPPPPRLVGGRPVGRVAAGVTLGGVGLVLVGLGAGALSVDGKCGAPPVPPATECDQIFQSLGPGAAIVGVGAAVALTGALIWAWPVRRAR